MATKPPTIKVTTDLFDAAFDAMVLVSTPISNLEDSLPDPAPAAFASLAALRKNDAAAKDGVSFLTPDAIPSKRLVVSPSGPLDRDQDDVRRLSDAAFAGIKRAVAAGARNPLLVAPAKIALPGFEESLLAAMLGALQAAYVPLEIREAFPNKSAKLDSLGIFVRENANEWRDGAVKLAEAVEAGRIVTRDIGGSDPERMAAPRVAEYVTAAFKDSKVTVDVISDRAKFETDYPCYAAVDRASTSVSRHAGRIIWLEYEGTGPIESTIFLVGKGITYDTGGADIKAGGVMAGMHRDKCGAATVAGIFKTLDILRPENVKVVGGLAMCRNSVGSECYVADEIITSRAGVRLRVGNTDAEGRMAMVDVLCQAKEKALQESVIKPVLMTIATLTGHAITAMGPHYSIVMANGPARKEKMAEFIQAAGHVTADPFEISTLRREDFDFVKAPSEYEEVLQANNKPSSQTPRGHQYPAAFLTIASGLDKHGQDSTRPLPYLHVDIAGSSGPFPGVPTGAPVPALTKYFLGL